MTRCEKLLQKARRSTANLGFNDLLRLAECHGFTLSRVKGSHYVLKLPSAKEVLTLQRARNNQAKPYQVRQLLALIGGQEEG